MVEHDLAKVGVASSNLVSRSIIIINCEITHDARVAKLVDAGDLKSPGSNTVPVQVRPRAPLIDKKLVPSPSGKAAACKAAIPSSNLGGTSSFIFIKQLHVDLWQSWSNALVLKTSEGYTSQSSNL